MGAFPEIPSMKHLSARAPQWCGPQVPRASPLLLALPLPRPQRVP